MSLDFIRKGHTWLTKAILILLAITFVIGFGFSITDFGASGALSQGTAAKVNGEKISLFDFYRIRGRLVDEYGLQGDLPEAASNFVNISALNQLIDSKLLSQKAKQIGFYITDDELSQSIRSLPAFQQDGEFIGADRYKQIIEQFFNEGVSEFENKYREELLANRLVDFIRNTAHVTDEELFNVYKTENEKINIEYIEVAAEDQFDKVDDIKDDEISAYYNENKDKFKNPETRIIRYLIIDNNTIEGNIETSDEEISAYYNAYKEEFKIDDKIPPLDEIKNEVVKSINEQKKNVILDEYIVKLEEIPEEDYSLDKVSEHLSIQGIKTSKPFTQDKNDENIPQQIVSKAFTSQVSQTDHTKIDDQIWIYQLDTIIEPKEKNLDDIKDQIIADIKNEKANELAERKAYEILNKTKDDNSKFNETAKEMDIEIKETGLFSRLDKIPGLDIKDLNLEAFNLSKENPIPKKVYKSSDKFYVFLFKEKEEIDNNSFEEKKEDLKVRELEKQRTQLFQNWIQKLRQESEIIPNNELFSYRG